MSELGPEIDLLASRALEILERLPAGDSITAWELKFKAKAQLSPLYMALGVLLERGKIRVQQDGLNYRIQPAAVKTQPIAGVPLEISSPTPS